MRRALLLVLCLTACGQPAQPHRTCGPDDFAYRDSLCGQLPDGGGGCSELGDGLCYLRCGSDAECPDEVPFCRTLGLYSGGDFNCNGSVRICREADSEDCPFHKGRR